MNWLAGWTYPIRVCYSVPMKGELTGLTYPYRRTTKRRRQGDEHERYGEAVRWMNNYKGFNSFVLSVRQQWFTKELTYKQVQAIIDIKDTD